VLNKLLSRTSRLEHADPAQRVHGIAELPADAAEFVGLLSADPAPEVRAAAAGRCADFAALGACWQTESEQAVREAIVESLGRALDEMPEGARPAAIDGIESQELLVEIAIAAAHAPVRMAAAERVHAPEALRRLAEAAKDRDRGVARLARQRVEAIDRRATQAARADELLAQAEALVEQPGPIVMAAVELERRWKALDLSDDAGRIARWDAAGQRLQARFEREREAQRAQAALQQQLTEWLGQLAAPEDSEQLGRLREELLRLRAAAQELNDAAALAKLAAAEQDIAKWEQAAPALDAAHALTVEAEQLAAGTGIDNAQLPVRWQALDLSVRTPELTRRFESALMIIESRRIAQARATQQQENSMRQQLHALLHEAEQALTAGQLQAARAAADQTRALKAAAGMLPKPTVQRLSRLVQQLVELERWHSFGQHNARVQLCERAEALAARREAAPAQVSSTAADGEADMGRPWNGWPRGGSAGSGQSLPPAQLAREVQQLRAEWKTLDQQHAGVPKSLWERFDSACEKAYAPAARHFAELHAQRKQARKQREEFIAAAAAHAPTLLAAPHDWRAIEHWLRDTDRAWHGADLGSVEPDAWKKLEARMKAALAPLRDALSAARSEAKSLRQALIAEAEALTPKAMEREAPGLVRELQARWQEQAKRIPLASRDERALWERFRAACNAVFDARHSQRREAEGHKREQRRAFELLCEQLEQLAHAADVDDAEVRRRLRETQEQWKQALGGAERQPPPIDARFRSAKSAVEATLAARSRGREAAVWQALLAKERLCEELDALVLAGDKAEDKAENVEAVVASVRSRWDELAPLSPAWEAKLLARRDAALRAFEDEDARYDLLDAIEDGAAARRDALLELELHYGIPSPADLQKERLAVQVKQLRSRFKSTAGSGSAGECLLCWCATPGVADARDRARCERLVESLARRH
jgi:hypothetical protein